MLITKKTGGGIPYARKMPYEYDGAKFEPDLKNLDIVTILDAGTLEPSNYGGEQFNFKIRTRNGEKKTSFNQPTLNVLYDEFGQDSENWVGKKVRCLLHKAVIGGKKVIIAYFVTAGWQLDEYGELTKPGKSKPVESEDLPEIEYPEEEADPFPG